MPSTPVIRKTTDDVTSFAFAPPSPMCVPPAGFTQTVRCNLRYRYRGNVCPTSGKLGQARSGQTECGGECNSVASSVRNMGGLKYKSLFGEMGVIKMKPVTLRFPQNDFRRHPVSQVSQVAPSTVEHHDVPGDVPCRYARLQKAVPWSNKVASSFMLFLNIVAMIDMRSQSVVRGSALHLSIFNISPFVFVSATEHDVERHTKDLFSPTNAETEQQSEAEPARRQFRSESTSSVFRVFDVLGRPLRGGGGSGLFDVSNRLFHAKSREHSPQPADNAILHGEIEERNGSKAQEEHSEDILDIESNALSQQASQDRSLKEYPSRNQQRIPNHSLEAENGKTYSVKANGTTGRMLQQERTDIHPVKSQSDVGKRLLELSACEKDDDCFGKGRRCIERRCWGFAGPESRSYLCRMGEHCDLTLKGHFYGTGDRVGDGVFAISIVEGDNFASCGVSASSKEQRSQTDIPHLARSPAHQMEHASQSEVPAYKDMSVTPDDLVLLDDEDTSQTTETSSVCRELGNNNAECSLSFPGPEAIFKDDVSLRRETTVHTSYIVIDTETATWDVLPPAQSGATHANSIPSLELVTPVKCTYANTDFRPRAYCRANLGVVVPRSNVRPGIFTICGCSSTDITNSGVPCSAVSDFAVPIGRLVIAGFDAQQTRNTQEGEQHREERELLLTQKTRVDDFSSFSETSKEESAPGSRRPETNDGSQEDVAANRGSLGRNTNATPADSSKENTLHTEAQNAYRSTVNRLPRAFICRIGSVCELSKMHGVGLDSGAFFVYALRGKHRDGCALLRDKNPLAQMNSPIRLPCKSYSGGSYCVVSARPAAVAALAAASEHGEHWRHPVTENGESSHGYALSSSSHSSTFVGEENVARSESAPRIKDAQNDYRKGDTSVIEDAPLLLDTRGDETPGDTPDTVLMPNGLPQQDAPTPTPFNEEFPNKIVRSSHGRKTQDTGGLGHDTETETNEEEADMSWVSSGHHGNAIRTQAIEEAEEMSTIIASATLCGCSSRSADESHCAVPVFLGYLHIIPPHGDLFVNKIHISQSTDNAEDPQVLARAEHEKNDSDGQETTGLYTYTRSADHVGEIRFPVENESQEKPLFSEDADNRGEMRGGNETIVASVSGTGSAIHRQMDTRKKEAVRPQKQREIISTNDPNEDFNGYTPSQWRLLQYISGPAANSQAAADGKKNDGRLANECKVNTDCFSGMGVCYKGRCVGFLPDKQDTRLFRCVEGYWCDIKPGDIPGKGINEKFEVIATTPSEPCGTARNLKPTESLFANANKWICDSSSPASCIFRAGVGHRRNKAHTVEGVRLCGCPNVDINGDDIPCNHVRDFFVPLGRLGVQECLTNAHCADNAFAYCIEDHCGGFLVSAAAAGVNAFTCIRNQQCTLQSIAAKSVDQALKVIPVAANFSCGAEAALDPEYVKVSALPCIADVNNDGVCDINLGVNRALGTTRLCGCSGQDVGGNGKTCDEASDFDRDLGLVANVQCIVNQDCPNNALCAKGECVEDDMEPYIVSMSPMNDTFAVPPLTYIDLIFNENIKFGRPGAAILIAVTMRKFGRSAATSDPSVATLQYLITLPNNAASLKKISAPILPSVATASSRLTTHASALGEERRRTEAKIGSSSSAFGKRTRDNAEDELHADQNSLFTGFGMTPVGNQSASNSSSGASSANSHSNKWTVEIIGQKLRITPDKDATSLPLGDYRVGVEFGFVTDLIGNMNKGENNLAFTLATDANCPFLYVTGFTTENGNCNGLYLPADPMNDQASWQGGEKNAFFIYWKKEVREGGKLQQGGNWIVDTNYDESSFLAFADLTEHANKKGGRNRAHPPSGLWHKWTGSSRRPQPHISMFCSSSPDRSPASLTSVDPLIGSSLPLSASSLLPLRPITLTFNKPMNYGHWATIKLIPRRSADKPAANGEDAPDTGRRNEEKGVVVWVPDVEGNMRGESIKIYNRPAREVVARSLVAVTHPKSTSSDEGKEENDPLEDGEDRQTPSVNAASNGPSESGSWALLRASSASRRLQHESSGSPPPVAPPAPEKRVGVVELHVTKPLIPGETYDLVAELGSLTDLAYNPWGPVEKGVLVFHTTGGRCASNITDSSLVFLLSPESSSTSASFFPALKGNSPGDSREGNDAEREKGGYFLAEKGREILGLQPGTGNEGADDGTQVRVVCRRGFSVHASLKGSKEAEETVLTCEDGRWKSYKALPHCVPSCGPFPLLPKGAYSMGGDVGGEGIEGESLDIRCSEFAEILTPISRQTVKCRNGKWDALQVKCGATCAPLGPILGPRYRVFIPVRPEQLGTNGSRGYEGEVTHAVVSGNTSSTRPGTSKRDLGTGKVLENREAKEGEIRTIVCSPGTSRVRNPKRGDLRFSALPSSSREAMSHANEDSEDGEEEALCGKSGWSKINLQCFADCPTEQLAALLAQYGPGLEWTTQGEKKRMRNTEHPGKHGELRTITCASDFLPSAATRSSFTTTCEDGKWKPLSPSPSSASPLCVPRCPSLDLPPNAYTVSALPDVIGPDGALQQRLEVACTPHAMSVSSERRQELICSRGGVWSLLTVQCQAPCSFPLLQLGDRYELYEQEDHITFRENGSQRSSGVSPAHQRGEPSTSDGGGDDVYKHGTELMIGCASGAAADGGGVSSSPHKIVCSDGVWKSAYRVMAAGPGSGLAARSGVRTPGESGTGLSGEHVSRENVAGVNVERVHSNGLYQSSSPSLLRHSEIELKCRRGCGVPALPPELRPLFLTPRVALLQRWHHEQQLQVTCAKGFSADSMGANGTNGGAYETLICRDGEWQSLHSNLRRENGDRSRSNVSSHSPSIPGLQLACHRGCEVSEIRRAAQAHHFDLPSSYTALSPAFSNSSLPHAASLGVSCQPGFSVMAGPTSGASLQCMYGSITLPHSVCGQPSCTDGVQNGDETGVDCGGAHCAPCMPCADGLQNNGETGVDCGGPCPACSPCAPPSPSQLFSPGAEPDVDALGALLLLPPPLSPDGDDMGAESAATSAFRHFLPFYDLLSQMESEFSTGAGGLPSGSALHLHCSHSASLLQSGSSSPATRPWAIFRCIRGQWLAASGRHGAQTGTAISSSAGRSGMPFFFSCPKPTCSDGVRNGDETGVDCGGSCEQACPSCFNGMRDGDEEDVDCGGSVCEPCEFCSPRPLKDFLANRDLFVVKRPSPTNKSETTTFQKYVDRRLTEEGIVAPVLTKPGQQIQIKCKAGNGDDSILVQCRNGIWALASTANSAWTSTSFSSFFASSRGTGLWWPKQAADARQALTAFRLACLASYSETASTPLDGSAAPSIDLASSSSPSPVSSLPTVPLTWRLGGSLTAFAVPDIGVTRHGSALPPCISRLLEVFRSSLRGECGALAFGSSALKLSSFCTNSCMRALKDALAGILGDLDEMGEKDRRDGDSEKASRALPFNGCTSPEDGLLAMKIALLLRELLATWCSQQNGLYCFSEAASSLQFLRNLYNQAEASPSFFRSELKSYCPANSCFRSNLKHVLILAELSDLVDIGLPAFFSGSLGNEATAMGPGASRALRMSAYRQGRRRLEATDSSEAGTDDADETEGGDAWESKARTHMIHDRREMNRGENRQKEAKGGEFEDGRTVEKREEMEIRRNTTDPASSSSLHSLAAVEPRRLFPSSSLASDPASPLVRLDLRQRVSSPSVASVNRDGIAGSSASTLGASLFPSRGTRGFLEDIRNIPEILDLMCIEVNGQTCVEDVLRVATENPVFASPSGSGEGAQKICKNDSCVLEVTRVFGQMLIDAADRRTENFFEKRIFHMHPTAGGRRDTVAYKWSNLIPGGHSNTDGGKRRGEGTAQSSGVYTLAEGNDQPTASDFHPYDVVLGVLMKHWGRSFCHRNIRGSLCGSYVFPSALDTALAEQSRGSYVPTENEKKYRACTCPHTLIGDGDCDLQCLNEACGWDGGDCLATEVLFPVYRHLVNQLGTEVADSCNPFNANFSCDTADASTSRLAPTSRRNCSHQFNRLADARGCCLATQLEVLRDLLDADVRILKATGSLAVSGGILSPSSPSSALLGGSVRDHQDAKASQSYADDVPHVAPQLWKGDILIQVDRSSTFFEFACKRQLDRTCSRGLNRFAYAVDTKITNLDLDSVLNSSLSSEILPQTSGRLTTSSGASSPLSASSLVSASPVSFPSAGVDGDADGREPGSSAQRTILALATTLSPRQRELRRVLREEIASLLAVPVGDVVDMRLWKGSIDVAAVVDPGWLANMSRFKDRLRSLTENPDSPLSIVALLSSALTRHLTSASHLSSPLLAVLPTWPSPRLLASVTNDVALPIALSPPHTKISQIPYQSTLPSSLPSSALRPLFGTFGVGELPVASRACVGTQGLNPPEGTSVYDAYKIWANSGRGGAGNEHGSTMVVECNTGHEAVEGEAPQTLICNQGRWEPLPPVSRILDKEPHQRILVCRRPCQPYEKIDPAVMRPEFIVSGYGTSDGDTRTVLCAPGYSPRDMEISGSTETIECVNGDWKPGRRLLCEKDFAALSGSTSSPCSGALSGLEESYRLTEVPLLPSANPEISQDLAAALKVRLQPHGTTVQVFKITCARGYTHATAQVDGASSGVSGSATSQGIRSVSTEKGNAGAVYLACLDGGLVGIGSQELFPLGGSAEGHRAEELAASFTERLRKATPVKIPSRSHALGFVNSTDDEASLSGHVSRSREGPVYSTTADSFTEKAGSDIAKSLVCLRDVRLDPPVGTKPLSDTAMVFLCLLILFVLVVALIAGWWMKNARKKRKCGKLAGDVVKRSDGEAQGDGGAEAESKRNVDFKRRTTGETVMMGGTVMVSGAGAEQFLANYLLGTGGTKMVPAADTSERCRDGIPPAAVVLARLKEQDLLAAQMYIDQAHAETSPSFAKPSELLTPATAAMVLGSTDSAPKAFFLLAQHQHKTRGRMSGTGTGTKTAGELRSGEAGEFGSYTAGSDVMERGEEDEKRKEKSVSTPYPLSPVYLEGLPGDSGSVQDVREQSIVEDMSQSTVASNVPCPLSMDVNQQQQLHMFRQQVGRNRVGLHMNQAEGEGHMTDSRCRDGRSNHTHQCLRASDVFSSVDPIHQGKMGNTFPHCQNRHNVGYLQQYEHALMQGKQLRGCCPAVGDEECGRVEETEDVDIHDIDPRIFGTGSPSFGFHHTGSNAMEIVGVKQELRHQEANQVSRMSQDLELAETQDITDGGDGGTAKGMRGIVQRSMRQGVGMWDNEADCRQSNYQDNVNSRIRSSSGPRVGFNARPRPVTERRHSFHLQHPDQKTNSSNDENTAEEYDAARYGGVLQDPAIQAHQQMLFSSQSDDELYPDDSASCVGQHGYRLGRDVGPMLLVGLHKSITKNSAKSELSVSPNFVDEKTRVKDKHAALHQQNRVQEDPCAVHPCWPSFKASQEGGR